MTVGGDHLVDEVFARCCISYFVEVDERAEMRMGGVEDLEG